KLVGSDASGLPSQGWSCGLSADGNTLIVGGPNDDNYNGAAWIFARSLPPQNLAIFPAQGGSGDVVTATVSATGLLDRATVRLVRGGKPHKHGNPGAHAPDGRRAHA